MAEAYIGEIRMFAGNFAPRGWQFCNGQLLPIAQYSAVFSLLGTTYGGNGVNNFALPDLRGRVPMHWGNGNGLSPYVLGQSAGVEQVTLLNTQMPMHTHVLSCNGSSASAVAATGNFPGTLDRGSTNIYETTGGAAMSPQAIGTAGGSQPHENLQPYLCVSFIICLEGIFPSRN